MGNVSWGGVGEGNNECKRGHDGRAVHGHRSMMGKRDKKGGDEASRVR